MKEKITVFLDMIQNCTGCKCVSQNCKKNFKSNKSSDNHDAYKLKRNEYQKLYRVKRIEFYTKKTTKDFTSSKKFWEFNASSMNLKKDKSNHKIPKSLKIGNDLIDEPANIAN